MPERELERNLFKEKRGNEWAELLQKSPDRLEAVILEEDSIPHWVYPLVLHFLLQLDMEEREARDHLLRIREHLRQMEAMLGRKVGFRVALLDYFHNIADFLVNPRIIEHELLEALIVRSKEDPKTGCCNAKYFRELVDTEIHRARRYDQKFSLLLLDIDDFKKINDAHGHIFGDLVLKEFTRVLKETIRVEDCVGRFGGDEFALLLPQTGRIGARCLAERVREVLTESFSSFCVDGDCAEVTFSGGIATFPFDGDGYEELTSTADGGLYRSKSLGKNRISDRLELGAPEGTIFPEKRQFRRFRTHEDRIVTLERADLPIPITGHLVNISTGGMLLECELDLSGIPADQPFLFNFRDGVLREAAAGNLKGRVLRTVADGDHLRVALSFEHALSDELWEGLSRLMKMIPA